VSRRLKLRSITKCADMKMRFIRAFAFAGQRRARTWHKFPPPAGRQFELGDLTYGSDIRVCVNATNTGTGHAMPPTELAERLALLLALSIFLGLAFEEIYKHDEPTVPGGIRTFPLVSLAAATLYLIEPHWSVAFSAGLLAMALWLHTFLRPEPPPETGRTGHRWTQCSWRAMGL
jgi:hypothetical protein